MDTQFSWAEKSKKKKKGEIPPVKDVSSGEVLFSVEDVSFGYQDKQVLKDASFTVNKGEFLCFMGSNGGGKTTMLQLFLGFLKKTSGDILYRGRSVDDWLSDARMKREYHQQVGILFQNVDVQLFNSTVYDEIAFGPRQMNLTAEQIDNRVQECLRIFGLEDLKDKVPYHLSGGEKREVALASVLALNPDVVLLDEPLVGLTNSNRKKMLSIFSELNKVGKTIIMVTHYFEIVQDIATSYAIFGDQKVVTKTREEIFADPDLLQKVREY